MKPSFAQYVQTRNQTRVESRDPQVPVIGDTSSAGGHVTGTGGTTLVTALRMAADRHPGEVRDLLQRLSRRDPELAAILGDSPDAMGKRPMRGPETVMPPEADGF